MGDENNMKHSDLKIKPLFAPKCEYQYQCKVIHLKDIENITSNHSRCLCLNKNDDEKIKCKVESDEISNIWTKQLSDSVYALQSLERYKKGKKPKQWKWADQFDINEYYSDYEIHRYNKLGIWC